MDFFLWFFVIVFYNHFLPFIIKLVSDIPLRRRLLRRVYAFYFGCSVVIGLITVSR